MISLSRDQYRFLFGLLAVHDPVTNFDRFFCHRVWILSRSGLKQASLAFERGGTVGRTVNSHNEELVSLRLFGGKIAANAGRIVDRENGVRFGNAVRRSVITRNPPSRLPPAFWSWDKILISGCFLNTLERTRHTVLH